MNENDTISRQAAISLPVKPKEDRYFRTCNLDDAYEYGWSDLQGCIKSLPSAHPETHEKRTETHECDCVSRQAAITVMTTALSEAGEYVRNCDSCPYNGRDLED